MRIGREGDSPCVQELGGDGVEPELRPDVEALCRAGMTLNEGFKRDIGGVAEGAQHSGNVAQRRLLGAALGEGASGLAFEVEQDVIAVRAKDLAEVVVPVDASAQAGGGCGRILLCAIGERLRNWLNDGLCAGMESQATTEYESGCVGGDGIGKGGKRALESVERANELCFDVAGIGGERLLGEGDRGKG